MSATLTLKNIPDGVYQSLKATAEANRRSMNSQAILCLEAALLPARNDSRAIIQRARQIRAELPKVDFSSADIAAFKEQGRLRS